MGWAKAGVSLAVRFSPRRLSPSVSIASAPLRTSASTRAGSLRGGSTVEAGPGPPVDPDPFLDLMNSWSRFALRRCAEFGAARLRCCGALIGSSHWRLAGASLATLPLVSMARLSAPILKTTRTPWTSTEYASVLLPTLHAHTCYLSIGRDTHSHTPLQCCATVLENTCDISIFFAHINFGFLRIL